MQNDKNLWNFRPAWMQLVSRNNVVGLEVGVAKGINAYNMLRFLDIKKLYLLDPYLPQSEVADSDGERPYGEGNYRQDKYKAESLLKPFEDKIEWIFETTEDGIGKISDESLSFVYIDGCHKYDSVKKDINLCIPKVIFGGVLGGHDWSSSHPGVVNAVLEKFGRDKIFSLHQDWWIIKE